MVPGALAHTDDVEALIAACAQSPSLENRTGATGTSIVSRIRSCVHSRCPSLVLVATTPSCWCLVVVVVVVVVLLLPPLSLSRICLSRSTLLAIVSADEKSDMVLVDVLMPCRGRRAERFSS